MQDHGVSSRGTYVSGFKKLVEGNKEQSQWFLGHFIYYRKTSTLETRLKDEYRHRLSPSVRAAPSLSTFFRAIGVSPPHMTDRQLKPEKYKTY
jgi:hypothetical protein